jgi:hypothetical protein
MGRRGKKSKRQTGFFNISRKGGAGVPEIRNPNIEIRNKFKIQREEIQNRWF